MDTLVKSALERVNETVNHIPWKTLEELKGKTSVSELESHNIENRIAKAVHAVDALKSALKTIW
jgi:flavin-binding protein dodecin